MSTIVVARKRGQVAIGADTLTCLGGTRERAAYVRDPSKILRLGDGYLATVGHASWGLVLASYFADLDSPPTLDSAAAIFRFSRTMHEALKRDYFLNPREGEDDEFESSQLDCLIANPHGIFGLYSQRSVQEYTRFYAFGSGYKFALGAMWATYDHVETAEEVARAGAAAGAEFDTSSAAPVEVFTVALRHDG